MAQYVCACPNCGERLLFEVTQQTGGMVGEALLLLDHAPADPNAPAIDPNAPATATAVGTPAATTTETLTGVPAAVEPTAETPAPAPPETVPTPPTEEAPAADAPAAEPQPTDTAPAPTTEQPVESPAPVEATTSPDVAAIVTAAPAAVASGESVQIQQALDDVNAALANDPNNPSLLDAQASLQAAQAEETPSA